MSAFGIFLFSLLLGYMLLLYCEKLVLKRINDFYVVLYAPYRIICFKMRPSLRKFRLPRDELEQRLRRDTIKLCKSIPSGTYYATTHERIVEALQHMQSKGRAKIIYCKKKGKPRTQKAIYKSIGNAKTLPRIQMFRIKFNIL